MMKYGSYKNRKQLTANEDVRCFLLLLLDIYGTEGRQLSLIGVTLIPFRPLL